MKILSHAVWLKVKTYFSSIKSTEEDLAAIWLKLKSIILRNVVTILLLNILFYQIASIILLKQNRTCFLYRQVKTLGNATYQRGGSRSI